jgi:CheY-like chemotaxis protein
LLIVDGSADAADSLALLLKLCGYETRAAYSAAEAVCAMSEYQPDAVLMELLLPDGTGYELAPRLRALHPQAVCIAVTTQDQDADRSRARQAGFTFHLVKPVLPDEMLDLLATLPDHLTTASIR